MLLVGSALAGIGRFTRRYAVSVSASRLLHHKKPKVFSDEFLPSAKKFLTLDIMNPASGQISSLGLYLMPRPSFLHGSRVYWATLIHQDSTVHSVRFITDGHNCLVVFVGDTTDSSLHFRMRPWSRRVTSTGRIPSTMALSFNDDTASACIQQYCTSARSIIDAEHPTTWSELNRVRRHIAKLLHPDLSSGTDVACRAYAMAVMNAELDELGSRFSE